MVKLEWYNYPIRTRAIIGKPPYKIITVDAGVSFINMEIVINRNRFFLKVFRDLLHEFGHIIFYHLGWKQGHTSHKFWDFIAVPEAFLQKWDIIDLWYGDKDA